MELPENMSVQVDPAEASLQSLAAELEEAIVEQSRVAAATYAQSFSQDAVAVGQSNAKASALRVALDRYIDFRVGWILAESRHAGAQLISIGSCPIVGEAKV